ncbi:MAG: hypothetical protein ACKOBB_11330, partial [Acidimicrobiaceae bacterium]
MSTTKAKSTRKFFALILATALITGACSSNQSTNSEDTSDEIATPTNDSTTDSNASEKVTLKLLAYDSFTPSPNIFDDFTEQTGIEVEIILGGDAGELVTKAGLTSGNPEADVLWGVDNTLLSRAISKEIFTPYATKNLADLDESARKLVPNNEATPVDTGDVCINYDVNW